LQCQDKKEIEYNSAISIELARVEIAANLKRPQNFHGLIIQLGSNLIKLPYWSKVFNMAWRPLFKICPSSIYELEVLEMESELMFDERSRFCYKTSLWARAKTCKGISS
jgi:hypothetical protein